MKYAVTFLLLGIFAALLSVNYREPWQIFVIANTAFCFLIMGLGFGWLGPGVFFKRSDGRLGWLSYLLFWPYHCLNAFSLALVRLQPKRHVFDEIVPGLYLGRKLTPFDKAAFGKLGIRGTLDLTCEFAESGFARAGGAYKCIPLLDTFAPNVEQLETGVQWMIEQARQGPLYIHCAMGHGRSATYVAAYLMAVGQAADIDTAVDVMQSKRPGVELTPVQRRALEEWLRRRNPCF